MNAYQFLKKIQDLCHQNDWQLETRQGSTSHQIIFLTTDKGRFTANLPMHKKDMGPGIKSNVLRNLNLKNHTF
jgi:ATP:corrinoid adenosyltransferase